MTGTIKSVDVVTALGFITAEDGVIIGFPFSAVMTYDLPVLAVGQMVSFDLEGGRRPKALNVQVLRASQGVNVAGKRLEIASLRYVGFEHRGNMRVYQFEIHIPGTQKRTLTVDADVALFTRHHVGIQEGPALCLHLLTEQLDAGNTVARSSFNCALSDREMLAYLASRPTPRVKHGFKRTPSASAVASPVA